MRDRTRTPCPYIASTMPQKAGEEAHENGIGMPPPPAAGAKVLYDVFETILETLRHWLGLDDHSSNSSSVSSALNVCPVCACLPVDTIESKQAACDAVYSSHVVAVGYVRPPPPRRIPTKSCPHSHGVTYGKNK